MNKKIFSTNVYDIGARYGMHPSWNEFRGLMNYIAFEPDPEEAERLRDNNPDESFRVFETAFDKDEGTRQFNLLQHRGLSSFLKPDLE